MITNHKLFCICKLLIRLIQGFSKGFANKLHVDFVFELWYCILDEIVECANQMARSICFSLYIRELVI
jgi:hypothetical protein